MQITTSNRALIGKNVVVKLSKPFATLAEHAESTECDPYRARPRTLEIIARWLRDTPKESRKPFDLLLNASAAERASIADSQRSSAPPASLAAFMCRFALPGTRPSPDTHAPRRISFAIRAEVPIAWRGDITSET